jgi:hypothetical protein
LGPKGYVRIVVYVGGRKKWIMEHRWVMQAIVGRPLTRAERVHHVDGNRSNNAPGNLVLCASQGEHLRLYHPELLRKLAAHQLMSPRTKC